MKKKSKINNNEEVLIQLFINKFETSKTNVVKISQKDIDNLNLSKDEVIRSIYILQEDDIINIKSRSVQNDFNIFWEIALKSNCIHYFEVKRENRNKNILDHFRFWLPVIISIIALILSI